MLDFQTSGDVNAAVRRLDTIFDCGIFAATNCSHPLFQSALIESVIHARDLTQKADKYATRVDFNDHITIPNPQKIKDVTDLLATVRNAVCHTGSDLHMLVPVL